MVTGLGDDGPASFEAGGDMEVSNCDRRRCWDTASIELEADVITYWQYEAISMDDVEMQSIVVRVDESG
jgi:hypothetical protein